MLTKKNRADKETVEIIFKKGKFINSPNFSFKFISDGASAGKKISFIVPKSVAKEAVERNRLRRRGYIALEQHINNFPALLGVFIFKNPLEDTQKIEDEIKIILGKIN